MFIWIEGSNPGVVQHAVELLTQVLQRNAHLDRSATLKAQHLAQTSLLSVLRQRRGIRNRPNLDEQHAPKFQRPHLTNLNYTSKKEQDSLRFSKVFQKAC